MKKIALIFGIVSLGFMFQACNKTETTDDVVVGNFEEQDYRAVVSMKGFENEGEAPAGMEDIIVEYDAIQKASRVTSSQGGMVMEAIETPDFIYVKIGDNWSKMPVDPAEKEKDAGMMTQEAIKGWLAEPGVKSLGEADCGDTKCAVFEQEINGVNTKIYIDIKAHFPQKVVSTLPEGGSTTVVYNYQDVEIELPNVEGVGSMPVTLGGNEEATIDMDEMEAMMKNAESEKVE